MPVLTNDEDIRKLLVSSRTIAVVGISANPSRDSYRVASYLLRSGYTIFPVNPNLRDVLGLAAYPDLESIPFPIDIVDVFRQPQHVPAVVESALGTGAKSIWMQLGVAHEEAARRAALAGMQVVMERCILVEHQRLVL